jgi:hypothetical protein
MGSAAERFSCFSGGVASHAVSLGISDHPKEWSENLDPCKSHSTLTDIVVSKVSFCLATESNFKPPSLRISSTSAIGKTKNCYEAGWFSGSFKTATAGNSALGCFLTQAVLPKGGVNAANYRSPLADHSAIERIEIED